MIVSFAIKPYVSLILPWLPALTSAATFNSNTRSTILKSRSTAISMHPIINAGGNRYIGKERIRNPADRVI